MNIRKTTVLLVLILSAISTLYVLKEVIYPNVDHRIRFMDTVFAGESEPPYQYRLLKPVIGESIRWILSPVATEHQSHLLAYTTIAFANFVGVFFLFYVYLRKYFSHRSSVIGVLLLQIVVPISITGTVMIGDFITVLFYVAGLNLIVYRKDAWLPAIFFFGAFNRIQIIFLLAFYVAYLIDQRALRDRLPIIAYSILAFAAGAAIPRLYFGLKPSRFTIAHHLANNSDPINLLRDTLPRWLPQIAGLVVLAIWGLRYCNRYFRLSLAALLVYLGLFVLKGNLWETAKFLPAFLVLIPVSLFVLTGERLTERDHAVSQPIT